MDDDRLYGFTRASNALLLSDADMLKTCREPLTTVDLERSIRDLKQSLADIEFQRAALRIYVRYRRRPPLGYKPDP